MGFDGEWRVTIATPLGKMVANLEIVSGAEGVRGTATQGDECVPFIDPVVHGDQLLWSQRVTRPLRLLLHFAVRVEGDRMAGTVRAGRLPASTLSGERVDTARVAEIQGAGAQP